jgi:hypothetical protein
MICELQGISELCGGQNVGGYRKVEYAPFPWIDFDNYEELISSNYRHINDVPFLDGNTWLSCYLLPQPRIFEEIEKNTSQGSYYQQSVQGTIAGQSPALSLELVSMKRYPYLLRLENREGEKFLLGTKEHPFRMTASFTTGPAHTALKSHRIIWESKTPHKAPGVYES